MTRISGRHILHAAGAGLLAATLGLPAGTAFAAADPHSRDATAGVPARATEPPPSPSPDDPTEPETPPDSPPDSEPPPDPDESADPTTSPPSTPGETDSHEPEEPDGTEGQTSDAPPEQPTEIDEATTTLGEQKEHVPAELTATVEALIALVGTVDDPNTLAQDRQAVIESAQHLSTALAAISAPDTPPELRQELTAIVKQVTSALEVVSGPAVPSDERSMLIVVIKRTTSTMDMICDPKTPQEARNPMIATVKDANHLAEISQDEGMAGSENASQNPPQSSGAPDASPEALQRVGASMDIARDRRTPPKERKELTRITQQVSALMKKMSDLGTSQQERSEAEKELEENTSRM